MKKILRYVGWILLALLLAIQVFHHTPNAGPAEGPGSLVARQPVPADVQQILRRACYDCHSNHTRYPWYAAVQPVAWWLDHHVTEGKRELNLSDFAAYDPKRTVRKLRAMADEVHDRAMPLKSYLLMHGEARLTDAEVRLVTDWAEALADDLESR